MILSCQRLAFTAPKVWRVLRRFRGSEVWLAFIDDTRQSDPKRAGIGPLQALGAVMMSVDALSPMATRMNEILNVHGVAEDVELKWKPPSDSPLAGCAKRHELQADVLRAAADIGVRSAVVIIEDVDIPEHWQPLERTILSWLYERIEKCLKRHNTQGVVISDRPGGGTPEHDKWLKDTLDLTEFGTRYVAAERVVLPIVTSPSKHLRQLQLADLIVGATTAAVAGNRYATAMAPLLRKLAHTDQVGVAADVGIKLYPRDLNNLHHWVFGEPNYQDATHDRGCRLPNPAWRYADDDGLS